MAALGPGPAGSGEAPPRDAANRSAVNRDPPPGQGGDIPDCCWTETLPYPQDVTALLKRKTSSAKTGSLQATHPARAAR